MFKRKLGERGIAHLAIIVIIALVAVGGAGYYVFTQQSKPNNKLVAEAFKKLECKIDDKDICKLYVATSAVKDLTMTIDVDNGEQGSGVYKKAGNNFSIAAKSTDDNLAYDVVTIGKTTYTKDPQDGKWWKIENNTDTTTSETFDDLTIKDPATDKTTYKKLGKEKCGDLTCFKYQMTEENKTVSTIWFDTRNYLLQKVTTTEDDKVMTITFNYNSPSIKAPADSDVKEMPTLDQTDLNGLSEEEMQQILDQYSQQAQ